MQPMTLPITIAKILIVMPATTPSLNCCCVEALASVVELVGDSVAMLFVGEVEGEAVVELVGDSVAMLFVGEVEGEAVGDSVGHDEPRRVPAMAPTKHVEEVRPLARVTPPGTSPHKPALLHTYMVESVVMRLSALGNVPVS